ncbi:MAG: twin-arginine translocase subunit TatC [Planctomycetota bacterium]
MSFGEHLEELRKRLFVSLVAIGVCVLGLLPFKTQITGIYVAPYQWMWQRLFADYLGEVKAEVAAVGTPGHVPTPKEQLVQDLRRERWEFLEKYGQSILDGSFPDEFLPEVNTRGGFQVRPTLVALGGLEDFWTFMAASLLFGLVLAAPIVLYQGWAFIAAGLYKHERKMVLKYVPLATVLLFGGIGFGYSTVVPWGSYFLMKLMNFMQVEPMLSVAQYFTLLLTMTAALGVVFQLPLVMLALQKIGIATYVGMRRSWRYVILGIFVLSAIITPSPDPFTQLMMAGPMCLLYVLGLVLCWRAQK